MTGLDRIALKDLETRPYETGAPAPDRILRGDPRHRTWLLDESADGKIFAGIWESTPGAWRIVYDEWEFCTILTGVSIVTPAGGAPVELKTGDSFVIRPGFTGAWDVVETTRKSFVIWLP